MKKAKEIYPNFFVIGGTKCGTSSMHYYLRQHENIYVPGKKEVDFLREGEMSGSRIVEKYKDYFSPGEGYKRRGDVTPGYLYWPKKVIKNIKSIYGDCKHNIKFILIIRDPVERFWSHYLHLKREGREDREFEEIVNGIDAGEWVSYEDWTSRYYQEGLYAYYLREWLSIFDIRQFMIIKSERLRSDTTNVMGEVFDFLGVCKKDCIDTKKINKASRVWSSKIKNFIGKPPEIVRFFVSSVLSKPKRREIRQKIKFWNQKEYEEKPSIPNSFREVLRSYYMEDINKLESITGRSLEDWK
jgi:hypothetical protein